MSLHISQHHNTYMNSSKCTIICNPYMLPFPQLSPNPDCVLIFRGGNMSYKQEWPVYCMLKFVSPLGHSVSQVPWPILPLFVVWCRLASTWAAPTMATERGKDRSLAAHCKWSIESAPGFGSNCVCVYVCVCLCGSLLLKSAVCATPRAMQICAHTYIHTCMHAFISTQCRRKAATRRRSLTRPMELI